MGILSCNSGVGVGVVDRMGINGVAWAPLLSGMAVIPYYGWELGEIEGLGDQEIGIMLKIIFYHLGSSPVGLLGISAAEVADASSWVELSRKP